MTDFEKDIYNKYLKISRIKQNRPYKERLNFENFENEESFVHIKTLAVFFNKYSHIKIEDFFNAPYYVYSDNKPYNLKFYSTYNGVKVYNIYEKKLLTLNPDNEQVLKRTKEGVRFIMQFCKDTKIPYKDYFTHYTDKINTFWMHLKENRINVYCLFLCDNLYNIYNRSDKDVINFMLDNLMKNINMYRTVYYNSIITKRVLSEIKHHFSH